MVESDTGRPLPARSASGVTLDVLGGGEAEVFGEDVPEGVDVRVSDSVCHGVGAGAGTWQDCGCFHAVADAPLTQGDAGLGTEVSLDRPGGAVAERRELGDTTAVAGVEA